MVLETRERSDWKNNCYVEASIEALSTVLSTILDGQICSDILSRIHVAIRLILVTNAN